MRTAVTLFLFALTTATTHAKVRTLEGEGTATNPFKIENATDWETFTQAINLVGGNYLTAYYELTDDITLGSAQNPVTTVIGTDANRFQGHLDGRNHTITVTMSRTEEHAALFGVVDGATFMNLTVDGTITSTKKYIAAFAAYANNTTNVTSFVNCTSNVTIDCQVAGDGSIGGFLGQNEKGTTNFENCIFTGSITGVAKTEKAGGFINWSGDGNCKVNYINCVMAGTIGVSKNVATFNRGNAKVTHTNSIYCINYGGIPKQGARQAVTTLNNEIGRVYHVGGTPYYIYIATITGVESTTVSYSGNVFELNPVVTAGGTTLTEGSDYTFTLQKKSGDSYVDASEIKAVGEYRVTLEGINDYAGTYVATITMKGLGNTWPELQASFAEGGTINLMYDYTADDTDEALQVGDNVSVVLNLNGHTINRNLATPKDYGYVINVSKTGSLVIEDNSVNADGIITGGKNNKQGGGIYCDGRLTLKSGNITGNQSKNSTGGGIYITGQGYFYMSGGAVTDNTAKGGGGGIHASVSKAFEITGGTISGNKGSSKGGGIRVRTAGKVIATITDCLITKNEALDTKDGKGGGVYFDGSDAKAMIELENCTITDNKAAVDGGGFYGLKGTATAYSCTFENNECVTNPIVGLDAPNASFVVALSDNDDNSRMLASMEGVTSVNVRLVGRKLLKNNEMNTLCLPFDVTEAQIAENDHPLHGAILMEMDVEGTYDDQGNLDASGTRQTSLDENTGLLDLYFRTVTSLEAGKPYLVKWDTTGEDDVENPIFTNVTLSCTTPDMAVESQDGNVRFEGQFSPFTLGDVSQGDDGNLNEILMLGSGCMLGYCNTPRALRPFRAHFYIPVSAGSLIRGLNMAFNVDEETGIAHLVSTQGRMADGAWYNLAGQRVNNSQFTIHNSQLNKGIFIHNGKIIKK